MSWNPQTHPYYVRRYRKINNPQLYNWTCDVKEYETLEQANADFNAPDRPGTTKVTMHQYAEPRHLELKSRKVARNKQSQEKAS
jgi:hypothetical protein